MVDYGYAGLETAPAPKGEDEGEDGEEGEDRVILKREKLSKIDAKAPAPELGRRLALMYAEGKAAYVDEMLSMIHGAKEGMLAKKREPKYDKLFQEYAALMKGKSEDEIRAKISEDAEDKLAEIAMGAFDETIGSPDFYNSLNIEMKIAGSKFGRQDVGVESIKKKELKEAAATYLRAVVNYAKKYGIDIEFDEKRALKTSARSKKAADIDANYGYA